MNILALPIIEGPVPWIVYAIAIAFVLVLLIRRPTGRWVGTAMLGIVVGGAIGLGVFLIANLLDLVGSQLPVEVCYWTVAVFAAIGLAVVSFRRSPVWRKVVAAIAIVWFAITGVIGVNAFYGLNPTLGSLFGVSSDGQIIIPTDGPTATPSGPLYQTWKPPADMPKQGKQGTEKIPATASGFDARDAGIYLPPAALVANPPQLPLVIMMMGFPGNPDPSYIGGVLDTFAAQHDGLAPIVVVADQIGGDGQSADPACADSAAYGKAETYITTDVVNWARANLNIIDDPKSWVVAGYSNGGGCAIKYGAKDPTMFRNILSVSGEEFPGSEDPDSVTAQVYGGDQAAFEAAKPINIMKAAPSGTYDGVTAVFTAGSEDTAYVASQQKVSAAALAVGMTVTNYVIPGAGHVGDALTSGLQEGFTVLYPVLGLTAP
ncbi:alpha/beta hydrolase-fold protein [Agromyces aureus]|uniref:Esterase n=1 Tax=Agromyces aureus TaxID=453304 RepID=A0A191WK84_9MICO|nr:alpha/beta hydrolase-fold protein [Agromyces aureus]ANJ28599.1 esterase [Agromyces aureus]